MFGRSWLFVLLMAIINSEIDDSLFNDDDTIQLLEWIDDSQINPFITNLWESRHDEGSFKYVVPPEEDKKQD